MRGELEGYQFFFDSGTLILGEKVKISEAMREQALLCAPQTFLVGSDYSNCFGPRTWARKAERTLTFHGSTLTDASASESEVVGLTVDQQGLLKLSLPFASLRESLEFFRSNLGRPALWTQNLRQALCGHLPHEEAIVQGLRSRGLNIRFLVLCSRREFRPKHLLWAQTELLKFVEEGFALFDPLLVPGFTVLVGNGEEDLPPPCLLTLHCPLKETDHLAEGRPYFLGREKTTRRYSLVGYEGPAADTPWPLLGTAGEGPVVRSLAQPAEHEPEEVPGPERRRNRGIISRLAEIGRFEFARRAGKDGLKHDVEDPWTAYCLPGEEPVRKFFELRGRASKARLSRVALADFLRHLEYQELELQLLQTAPKYHESTNSWRETES